MNRDALIAYLLAFIIIALSFRLVLIGIRLALYIKKYHPEHWQNNFFLFFPGGRSSISQLAKGLDDPKIQEFKRKEMAALKQLILAVVIIFFMLLAMAFLKLI